MRFSLVAVGAVAIVASSVQAAVTWNGAIGNWATGSNWVDGVAPVTGDDIIVNGGTVELWMGGPLNTLNTDTTLTLGGGTIGFPNQAHWVKVGTGGTGTASSLTINGGIYAMKGGELAVGNETGEIGLVTVNPGGTLSAADAWINLEDTGTINVAGTMTNFGSVNLMGGAINITGGAFDAASVNFESNGATGNRFNISGGTVTIDTVSAGELGYGNRYFNFTSDSSGTLILVNRDVTTVTGYLNSSYIRLDGAKDVAAFSVTPFGASGAQVSLVPEPAAMTLLSLGLCALVRRRRSCLS